MAMHLTTRFTGLLSILLFLCPATVFGQAGDEPEQQDAGPNPGQEVEITEDNYRQFMELKDPRQRRAILPEEAFKSAIGQQKIDKLPEDSQKHLRNQLREIILQGDQWQPGDENKNYPYVPSAAAVADRELQKQEAEAWGELVNNYHRREAEIYENSARTEAAMADSGTDSGGANTGKGSPGDGTGQPGGQQQESRQSQANQANSAAGYSPNAPTDPNAKGTAGVSQNAMEYLQRMAQQGAEGSGGSPTPGAASSTTSESDSTSMAGTSQNAMEFLQQSTSQGDGTSDGAADSSLADSGQEVKESASQDVQADGEQQADTGAPSALASAENGAGEEGESTMGVSQNALEFLTGDERQPGRGQEPAVAPAGTLSIQDLINAQGVGGASAAPPVIRPEDRQDPEPPPPDKDGNG